MHHPAPAAVPGFASQAFRTDDVRGRFGQEIDHRFAHAFGRAVGERAMRSGCRSVVVGRDARLSSIELAAALQAGIRDTGMNIIDIGMAPTPLTWFAARLTDTGAAVSVTGGHDEEASNGFKVMLGGSVLGGPALQALRPAMQPSTAHQDGRYGTRTGMDAARCYAARVASDVILARTVKVALDCSDSVRALAVEVLEETGCEVLDVSRQPRYEAGSHDPRHALPRLATYLRHTDCEIGLLLGGDGDRIGVAHRSGIATGTDRLALLLARDMLPGRAGMRVLHDVGSTRLLPREVRQLGGFPVMCHGGEVCMATQMRQSDAMLGAEMNGSIRFRDRWNGYSDGLYAAVRLLEILSRHPDAGEALEALPQTYSTPEFRLALHYGEPDRLIEALRADGQFARARSIRHVEGVRVEYDDGFAMARVAPAGIAVLMRFEGDDGAALWRIQEEFRRHLLEFSPGLKLPF
ncbi:phosphoglucomutase [Bordetella ansorpii]|uniref:Phosphoglucomutase n=1 Tax=Bordetella ansorpii TaxID=288768 RepID=A0A157S564_9BORD|nr:hypothetical protein [Bordetella ansorpii]SAI65547.1 phosphoglucomutase [Bordetella ansorpii]